MSDGDGGDESSRSRPSAATAVATAKMTTVKVTVPQVDPACSDRAGAGSCAAWAASGECDNNPAFMLNECASTCHACDKAARCAWQADDATPLGVPANTHASFVDRAAALASRLNSERPSSSEHDPAESKVLSHDPLVVVIDGFLSHSEAVQLRSSATGLGFQPSEINIGKGGSTEWKRSSHRNSSTVFCDEKCYQRMLAVSMTGSDCLAPCLASPCLLLIFSVAGSSPVTTAGEPAIALALARAEEVTRMGTAHTELQFLHYEVGQYYKLHHDYLGGTQKLLAGPRALSVLL